MTVPIISLSAARIEAGITLRDPSLPENGNQALHMALDPAAVLANRNALADQTLPLSCWVLPEQKHTACMKRVTRLDAGSGARDLDSAISCCDALYTTEPGLLIGVYTADCLGILVYDETTPLAAVIHSGWKGTAQNILYKSMKSLLEQDLIHPETTQVFFSPSIQKDSFEIGPEVVRQLLQAGAAIHLDYAPFISSGEGDRSFADNQAMNVEVLKSLGIPETNIHPSHRDTKKDPACFSFRRDGKACGEHFTWACIKS